MESELPVEPQSLKKLSFKSLKRALDLFSPLHGQFPPPDPVSKKIRMSHKLNAEYGGIRSTTAQSPNHANLAAQQVPQASTTLALTGSESSRDPQKGGAQNELVVVPSVQPKGLGDTSFTGKSTTIIPAHGTSDRNLSTAALMERIPSRWPRPVWRPPWRNYRVISGHLGWVRSVAFDPSNEWFCTGSADRTIKVIRSYHGHLSSVYFLALHPTVDVLLTGGCDSVCRVWDIRSKMQIHELSGNDNTVCSAFTRPTSDLKLKKFLHIIVESPVFPVIYDHNSGCCSQCSRSAFS